MQTFDFLCEKASKNDDIAKIAKYIHLTDPYIYPKISKLPDNAEWVGFIGQCLDIHDNVFSRNNISLIKCNGEIIGIACVISCSKKHSVTRGIEIPDSLSSGMKIAFEGYFSPLIRESEEFEGYNITNICIDESFRGKGAGSALMSYCVNQYGKDHTLHLDVIADNAPAIKLYTKFGFSIEYQYTGFSGDDSQLPCYHMVRSKGAVIPNQI